MFEIRSIDTPKTVFVGLIGEFDLAGRDLFKSKLLPLQSPDKSVHVDMSELSFLDCSGVGLLVELRNQLEQAGNHLQLRGAKGIVQRVLDITGTPQVDRPSEPTRPVHLRTRALLDH